MDIFYIHIFATLDHRMFCHLRVLCNMVCILESSENICLIFRDRHDVDILVTNEGFYTFDSIGFQIAMPAQNE